MSAVNTLIGSDKVKLLVHQDGKCLFSKPLQSKKVNEKLKLGGREQQGLRGVEPSCKLIIALSHTHLGRA